MNCDFNSKLFSFTFGSFMQEGSDVRMGKNLSCNEAITGF